MYLQEASTMLSWVCFRNFLSRAAKPVFQLILLVIFLHFFGLPAIETYVKKEVMVVENKRDTDGIPFPAITIAALSQEDPEACFNLKDGSVERCIEEKSLKSSDLLKGVQVGYEGSGYRSTLLNVTKDMITQDSTQFWSGVHFTLNLNLTIGLDDSDYINLLLPNENIKFQIFVHDPKFFIFSDNPLAFPMEMRLFTTETSNSHCYRLNLIEMNEHNVPSDPCNTDPHFNFWECLKDSVSQKVFPSFLHERLIFLTGWLQHQVGPTKQSTLHKQ